MMCITPHWLKTVFVRITPYSWVIHDERLIDRLFSLGSSICSFPCVSLFHFALLFPLQLVLCPEPLLPCGQRQGKHYLRVRQSRSLWQNTLLTQVMSPSSLTTSTTRRLLKSSSRRNPATKTGCLRTCVARNSTMRPSGKRSFHHCPFMRRQEPADRRQSLSLL